MVARKFRVLEVAGSNPVFPTTKLFMGKLRQIYISKFESRIHEIDLLRGFLIILVVFDHLMWFINFYCFHYTNGFLTWYWNSNLRFIVRQIVLMLFMFTCGISCHFSRNNKKRGFILLALALFVTLGTHILQITPMFTNRVVIIDINILGVIALSILLYAICQKLKTKDLFYVIGILLIFYVLITVTYNQDTSGVYNPLTSILYCPFNPIKAGYVGDYLPLFPYVIFLFLGVIFARFFYKEKKSIIVKKGKWERPICFLGRHTLVIYILHEILFTGIFIGISALI